MSLQQIPETGCDLTDDTADCDEDGVLNER